MTHAFLLDRLSEINQRVDGYKQAGVYAFCSHIEPIDPPWYEVNGERMLMATSYSYLGLMHHEAIKAAAAAAGQQYGFGSHGSPVLAGTTPLHARLEADLAHFLGADDALTFSSGFVTNATVIAGLMSPGDTVVTDRQNHASILAGARYSGASVATYAHQDLEDLQRVLTEAHRAGSRTLVVVDAVFSMEGTIADIPRIVRLCEEFDAALMVDEAHSLGVLGETGRGVVEHFDLRPDQIDIRMGTLSKSIPSCGGYVAGSERLVHGLRHSNEGYLFSGALTAPQVAAAQAGLDILATHPELPQQLHKKADSVRARLRAADLAVPGEGTPIIPVVVEDEQAVFGLWLKCLANQIFIMPVVHPAVPRRAPRLRISLTNDLEEAELDLLVDAVVSGAGY